MRGCLTWAHSRSWQCFRRQLHLRQQAATLSRRRRRETPQPPLGLLPNLLRLRRRHLHREPGMPFTDERIRSGEWAMQAYYKPQQAWDLARALGTAARGHKARWGPGQHLGRGAGGGGEGGRAGQLARAPWEETVGQR